MLKNVKYILQDIYFLDVMTVIAHFPRLLDSSYQESLKSLLDGQPPDFPENEFRNGLQSLAPYLASVCLSTTNISYCALPFSILLCLSLFILYLGTNGTRKGSY